MRLHTFILAVSLPLSGTAVLNALHSLGRKLDEEYGLKFHWWNNAVLTDRLAPRRAVALRYLSAPEVDYLCGADRTPSTGRLELARYFAVRFKEKYHLWNPGGVKNQDVFAAQMFDAVQDGCDLSEAMVGQLARALVDDRSLRRGLFLARTEPRLDVQLECWAELAKVDLLDVYSLVNALSSYFERPNLTLDLSLDQTTAQLSEVGITSLSITEDGWAAEFEGAAPLFMTLKSQGQNRDLQQALEALFQEGHTTVEVGHDRGTRLFYDSERLADAMNLPESGTLHFELSPPIEERQFTFRWPGGYIQLFGTLSLQSWGACPLTVSIESLCGVQLELVTFPMGKGDGRITIKLREALHHYSLRDADLPLLQLVEALGSGAGRLELGIEREAPFMTVVLAEAVDVRTQTLTKLVGWTKDLFEVEQHLLRRRWIEQPLPPLSFPLTQSLLEEWRPQFQMLRLWLEGQTQQSFERKLTLNHFPLHFAMEEGVAPLHCRLREEIFYDGMPLVQLQSWCSNPKLEFLHRKKLLTFPDTQTARKKVKGPLLVLLTGSAAVQITRLTAQNDPIA